MPTEPSLGFQQETTASPVFQDEGLDTGNPQGSIPQFYASLLTSVADLDRLYETDRERAALTLIEETDFTTHAILVVQTGWGSNTFRPHLERIEETDDGIHAFGCRQLPCAADGDVTSRSVVARFDRPDRLESTVVSHTYDATTRVTVAAGEGVISIEEL